MYCSFYALKQKPFQITTDPRFLWLGEKHKEALSILKYGILDNKWFLLLTGDVGTGKTTLINALLQSLDDSVIVAIIPDPGLDELDLFNYIADLYDINRIFTTKGEFLIHFKRFLNNTHDNGKKILFIIDEAQRLNQERLEVIRLLSNIERQETKLINIFFVGQNEFNDTLRRPENRALRQRITINYNISPLTAGETAEYIAHRLKVAGAAKKIFHPDAVKKIAAYSGGYPRLINVLCDYALVTGYVKGAQVILPAIIDECAQELKIPRGAPLPHQESVDVTVPVPPTSSGADAAPLTTESSSKAALLVSPNRSQSTRVASVTPSDRSPVKVLVQQAHMPSKRTHRMTGLYVALGLGIVLGLGVLLYLLPNGFLPLSEWYKSKPLEKVEKSTATTGSSEVPIPGISGISEAKKEVAMPSVSVQDQESSDTPNVVTESVSVHDDLGPNENAGKARESEAFSSTQPYESPPSSVENPGDGIEKQIASDTQPLKTPIPTREPDTVFLPEGKVLTPINPAQVPLSSPEASADDAVGDNTELQDNLDRLSREKKLLVYFGRDSNDMQKNTFALLDALSVFMGRHPTAQLVIRGYTDSSGVYSYNKKLSEFRANMVKSYLVGKGTNSSRIQTLGMGPANPLKSNQHEKTRRFNRRVEIEIVMNAQQEGGTEPAPG